MTRVVAPSRLHFGLLHVPVEGLADWPGGLPVRRFGGVGVMVKRPGLSLHVGPASDWFAEGPSATRALGFARRAAEFLGSDHRFRIVVQACPSEHVGLGVGTQLGLAAARAIAGELGREDLGAVELAQTVGRGERSAIGIHGFQRGGLIVDGGKADASGVSALLGRYPIPDEWRFVLARPKSELPGWSGDRECSAFARQRDPDEARKHAERLARLLVLGVLPAIVEHDVKAFGAAVTEFNREAGRPFADDQGGTYASAASSAMIELALNSGAAGAGQTSWGPTIFALAADEVHAVRIADRLRGAFNEVEAVISEPDNEGARAIATASD